MLRKLMAFAALAVAVVTLASTATASPVAADSPVGIDASVASYHRAVTNVMANPKYNPAGIAAALRIGVPLNYLAR
jgi:hypothetical protein